MTGDVLKPLGPRVSDAELLQVLVQHGTPGVSGVWADADRAVRQLKTMMAEGRATWVGVELDASRFVAHVARHVKPGTVLQELSAAGLFLAAGCLQGLPRANAYLDVLVRQQAQQCTRRLNVPEAMGDELMQCVRVKLLVPVGEAEPAIATYAGLGPIENWLGVIMTRTALNLLRGGVNSAIPLTEATEQRIGAEDPDLQLIRERYQAEFTAALREAMARLTDKQRALLRLNVVHGLGVDRLAAMHRVGRTTAARWMTDIRQKIRKEMHQLLVQRFKITGSELRSLARLMRSQIDASIERVLQEPDP